LADRVIAYVLTKRAAQEAVEDNEEPGALDSIEGQGPTMVDRFNSS
jgi:hypothetical protein